MKLDRRSAAAATTLALLGILLAASTAQVSFARQIQPIFDNACVACHQTGASEQGLVLEEGKSLAMLLDASREAAMPRVTPGQPDASYLLAKISGTQRQAGGGGARMPLGSALDADAVALIRAWISEGARDN